MVRRFPIEEPLPPPKVRTQEAIIKDRQDIALDAEIQAWLDLCDRAYNQLTPQGWQRWVFTVGFVDPLGLRLKIGGAALARLKGIHGAE